MLRAEHFLTGAAALAALSIAIFVFAFPRTRDILENRKITVSKVDVPEPVRKSKRFRFEIYLDCFLLYAVSYFSIILGFFFTGILIDVVNIYLKLPLQLGLSIPDAFGLGVRLLGLLIWSLIAA